VRNQKEKVGANSNNDSINQTVRDIYWVLKERRPHHS